MERNTKSNGNTENEYDIIIFSDLDFNIIYTNVAFYINKNVHYILIRIIAILFEIRMNKVKEIKNAIKMHWHTRHS